MSDLHSQKTGLIVRRRSTEQEQILRQLNAEKAMGEEIRAAEYEKIANITGLYRHTIQVVITRQETARQTQRSVTAYHRSENCRTRLRDGS